MPVNRLESFSDGVFAVAITLLVLGIEVPPVGGEHSLAHELGRNWPQYAAYAVSFVTIGIIWINHHVVISRLRATDHAILILNLVLLMTVGLLPFATDLIATHLSDARTRSLAAAVYAGAFALMGLAFSVLNYTILIHRTGLQTIVLPLDRRRQILVRAAGGNIPYLAATGLAFVSPYITLAICAALALFYALPIASGIDAEAAQ